MPRAPQAVRCWREKPIGKTFCVSQSGCRACDRCPEQSDIDEDDARHEPLPAVHPDARMKASAWPSDPAAVAAGDPADRCEAMVSSAHAIRSAISCPEDARGAFLSLITGDFRTGGPAERNRGAVLLGFFDIFRIPDDAPLNGPYRGPQAAANQGTGSVCNWDSGRYSPSEFARTG